MNEQLAERDAEWEAGLITLLVGSGIDATLNGNQHPETDFFAMETVYRYADMRLARIRYDLANLSEAQFYDTVRDTVLLYDKDYSGDPEVSNIKLAYSFEYVLDLCRVLPQLDAPRAKRFIEKCLSATETSPQMSMVGIGTLVHSGELGRDSTLWCQALNHPDEEVAMTAAQCYEAALSN